MSVCRLLCLALGCACCLSGLALTAGAAAQGRGRTLRQSRPFVLECKFKDDVFADDAMAVLQQVWVLAEKHFAPTAKMKNRKLGVFVYDDKAEYAKAAAAHRKREFEKFQGFADGRTMTCHVLKSDAPWWTAASMDPGNRHVIAHEAAHLVVMLCSTNRGNFLPKWVAEGIPIWMEGEVMQAGGWAKDRRSDVVEGGKVLLARQMIQAKRFPKVEDVLDSKWGASSEVDAYYPIQMLWTYIDEEHGARLGDILRVVRETPASAALPAILKSSFRTCVGGMEFEKLDTELQEFVAKREIIPMRGVVPLPHDVVGKPGDADFKPGSPAVRWLGGTTKKDFVITARLTIRAQGFPQSDLVLGRRGHHWLRISLVVGAGVYLLAREDRVMADGAVVPGTWEIVAANKDVPALVADKPLALRLWARGKNITFSIDGKKALDVEVGERPLQGKWGVGGPHGSVASWSAVRIR